MNTHTKASSGSKVIAKNNAFEKYVKLQSKGLSTRNACVKYESPTSIGPKVVTKVLQLLKNMSKFKLKVTR